MKKYAKVINEESKACEVGLGTNSNFYQSIGMTEMEVEEAYDGNWYVLGFAPEKPLPTYEEVRQTREALYRDQKDPITCQIQSLRDEEETEEILAEIEALKVKRAEIVAKIKEENPYPEENE
nr:MAG TPA: hypothetical protein [Caudoviricetes sp.]